MQLVDGRLNLSPSDVTGFLACEHMTKLSVDVAYGRIDKPDAVDAQAQLVFDKGLEHEAAYLADVKAQSKSVVDVEPSPADWDGAVERTQAAMRAGVDVIYQGVFVSGRWRGVADFVERVERPSGLGAWSYEALDTKLARHSKPAYILQLCFYDEQIGVIQGVQPESIHVLLGSGVRQSFRPQEFAAYYRRVRSRTEAFVDNPLDTTPWPNANCGNCGFKARCDAFWDEIDHLSRVAGIRRPQIDALNEAGVTTLADLAGSDPTAPPKGVTSEAWAKITEQAGLQYESRLSGRDTYHLMQPKPGLGFALLPEPSRGDLFFDFEGNPFWDADGSLEYLWGITDENDAFTPIHAYDRESEKAALEQFLDLVQARRAEFPDMHVYHYAPYEISALKRLVGWYGTREDVLDDLLRNEVFVDLYAVVRNGIRTSRPGYGLKEMEAFLPIERKAEVKDGGTSIVVFEEWMRTRDDDLLRQIDDYNREDCISTRLLRDWLLELREDVIAKWGPLVRPEPQERKSAPEGVDEADALRAALIDAGEETAAQLLDYHAREAKPVWWAFFERLGRSHEELLEDAEAITGLVQVGEPIPSKRSFEWTLEYPPQEHKIRTGSEVRDRETARSAGSLVSVDAEARRIVLRRGPSLTDVPLPEALIPGGPYTTKDQRGALERFGKSLLAGDHRYPALESILRRKAFDRPIQTADLDEMKTLLRSLGGRHLVIQGPPGSGKTWTSGRLIVDLIEAGKRVGVASTSHKAIHNLLDSIEEAAAERGRPFTGLKKASAGNPESRYESDHIDSVDDAAACTDCDLTAGTAWLYSREDQDAKLDYLFIDEAGQVSLADALAMGTSAKNVVLVGDPQQLAQVTQGTHPGGTGASVLAWLLEEHQTIPPDRGLFLERTYRLHPEVCGFISDEFYEGRLTPAEKARRRATPAGTGLRFIALEHEGNTQTSDEEVDAIAAEIARLKPLGVSESDVMVVAPYNMQVEALNKALPGVRVGTVDKFQGQEAPVVFYSMASSSGDDVPRGLEFLLSRNRLNVAISRAQCRAYLVASQRLLEVNCTTIDQMRLANAMCRFVEFAA